MKKSMRFLALLTAGFYFLSVPGFAATLEGKIQSVTAHDSGVMEIVVETAQGPAYFIVNESTLIEVSVPVKKVKNGQRIVFGSGVKSGKRGFRSPFRGISKSMRKQMGLPELPSTPDVPGKPDVPEVPKVPKAPKIKGNTGGGEEGNQAAGEEKERSKVIPEEAEPTEEEKSLYGRMESGKSLAPATAPLASEVTPFPKPETKTVINIAREESGVKLELETESGKREELILAPDKEVLQSLSGKDLQKNMTVSLEVTQAQEGWLARRIIVRE